VHAPRRQAGCEQVIGQAATVHHQGIGMGKAGRLVIAAKPRHVHRAAWHPRQARGAAHPGLHQVRPQPLEFTPQLVARQRIPHRAQRQFAARDVHRQRLRQRGTLPQHRMHGAAALGEPRAQTPEKTLRAAEPAAGDDLHRAHAG
jgi:hypothetical protein